MRQISADALDDIARGAAVLGTGGGGDPYIGKLMAQGTLRRRGDVNLLDPMELADDDIVVPSAMMGAPTVMVEKIPRGEEIVNAFKALQTYLGRPVRATMSCEAGGLNSTTPFTVAAELGIPLVDADMMGRAFPELQMCTPTLYGVTATPMAIADEKGNSAVINTINNRWTETLARTLTIDMGCSAMIAIFPMTGKQVKESCVLNTISLVERIGRTIREARQRHVDPVEAVRQATNGYLIWRGKVGDVARRTETGFARGEATITGVDEYDGRSLRIAFQNEFLIAQSRRRRPGDDPRPDHHPRRRNRRADHDRRTALRLPGLGPLHAVRPALADTGRTGQSSAPATSATTFPTCRSKSEGDWRRRGKDTRTTPRHPGTPAPRHHRKEGDGDDVRGVIRQDGSDRGGGLRPSRLPVQLGRDLLGGADLLRDIPAGRRGEPPDGLHARAQPGA